MTLLLETAVCIAVVAMAVQTTRAIRSKNGSAALHILAAGATGSAFFVLIPFFGNAALAMSLITALVGLLLLVDGPRPARRSNGELGEETATRRK